MEGKGRSMLVGDWEATQDGSGANDTPKANRTIHMRERALLLCSASGPFKRSFASPNIQI